MRPDFNKKLDLLILSLQSLFDDCIKVITKYETNDNLEYEEGLEIMKLINTIEIH